MQTEKKGKEELPTKMSFKRNVYKTTQSYRQTYTFSKQRLCHQVSKHLRFATVQEMSIREHA